MIGVQSVVVKKEDLRDLVSERVARELLVEGEDRFHVADVVVRDSFRERAVVTAHRYGVRRPASSQISSAELSQTREPGM